MPTLWERLGSVGSVFVRFAIGLSFFSAAHAFSNLGADINGTATGIRIVTTLPTTQNGPLVVHRRAELLRSQ